MRRMSKTGIGPADIEPKCESALEAGLEAARDAGDVARGGSGVT